MDRPYKQVLVDRMMGLQHNSPDIEAAAVVSLDGLIVASSLLPTMSEDRVSAMSAAILSLGEQICNEMGRGILEQIHIKGRLGHIVLMAIDETRVFTLLVSSTAKLGLLFLEMRRAVDDLRLILKEMS
ncbi:MAG: roadblock/LC7 domain-containing protein [Chloroflexi bacterium]|nr:roadblock/LC7 domain-containing protein [Chloroflexota bacterium]